MGFSITSDMQLINPAYGSLPITVSTSDVSIGNLSIDLYIGEGGKTKFDGDKRTIIEENTTLLDIDIQSIVQPYFTNDASGTPELKRLDIVGNYTYTDISINSEISRNDRFSVLKNLSGSTGYSPSGTLIRDGSILYGMTFLGGVYGGTIFKMTRDGSSFSVLKYLNFSTGYNPYGSLIQDGSTLYGMTYEGGHYDKGVIFRMSRDGSTYTILKHMNDASGTYPNGDLTRDGSTLYGMTYLGGDYNSGVIFRMNRDGSAYIILKHFNDSDPSSGFRPLGNVILDVSTLYGMTYLGGLHGDGTIFKIGRDGSSYTILRNLERNSGYNPLGSLILDGSTLYGMASKGGNEDLGTIFRINTDGNSFSVIKHLNVSSGYNPTESLVLDVSTLYGMNLFGGGNNNGNIFKVGVDKNNYTSIKSFDLSTGVTPYGGLTKDGSTLYGMTYSYGTGGSNGGTIFKVILDANIKDVSSFMSFDVSSYLGNYYLYNGILRSNYHDYDFILNGSINGSFLNTFSSPLSIHPNDPINLHFLTGTFYRETLTGSTKIYDVSTSTFTITNVSTGSVSKGVKLTPGVTPQIYTWNICPSSMNDQAPDLSINGSTQYYTIRPANNVNTTRINIVKSDPRFTPKRVQWVDSNGAINYFNFDLAKNNDIEIEKVDYPNYRSNRSVFGTTVKNNYTLTSNWITEKESLSLKELWYSPSVMIDGKYVILDMNSIDILIKKNNLINYTISYYPSDKYIVQKN